MEGERNTESILIVEDDADTRELLGEALLAVGYSVRTAANGRDALAEMHRRPPIDAVILDLMMPGMNGWQFRDAQLAEPELAAVPVIVLTARPLTDTGALNAQAVLRKPVDLDLLLQMVGMCTGRR